MALHKHWSEYTRDEIYKTVNEKCRNYPYASGQAMSNDRQRVLCNYMEITGTRRGCRPEDCSHNLDTGVKKRRKTAL